MAGPRDDLQAGLDFASTQRQLNSRLLNLMYPFDCAEQPRRQQLSETETHSTSGFVRAGIVERRLHGKVRMF